MLDIYILFEYNIHILNTEVSIMNSKMMKCKSCGNDIAANAKSCPNCGAKNSKSSLKKVLIGICIFAVLIIFIAAVSGGDDSSTPSSGNAGNNAVSEAPIVVSADELIMAYVNNTVTADATYKGKTVTVSGTIYSIESNYISIEADADDLWLNNVYAYYSSSETSKLSNLAKGDRITVTGECKGEGVFSDIEIKYCTIN